MLRWKLTADWGTEERIKFFRTEAQAQYAEFYINIYAKVFRLKVVTKVKEVKT